MSEVTINGNVYRTLKMDAFKQFHVARRLAPVLLSFLTAQQQIRDLIGGVLNQTEGETEVEETKDEAPPADLSMAPFMPVADALSKMSDTDSEYVLNACLDAVQRQQPGDLWAPVRIKNGRLMFADIDMPTMMRLVFVVVQENMGSFFPLALADAKPQSASATSA